MKIRATVVEEQAFISCVLFSPLIEKGGSIKFVVDTGSQKTCISVKDAVTLCIDYSKLNRSPRTVAGISGWTEGYILPNAAFVFTTEEGKSCVEEMDEIIVFRYREGKFGGKREEKLRKIAFITPSLLGVDLLKRCKLYADFKNKDVYLETQQ